jgi:hypothetical protein
MMIWGRIHPVLMRTTLISLIFASAVAAVATQEPRSSTPGDADAMAASGDRGI